MERDRYPANWTVIADAAKAAAGGRCQGCGAAHREDGTNGSILTVHHPDRDPENPDARLTALCARCHLAVEAIARRREQRLAGVGVPDAVHALQLSIGGEA